MSSHSTCSHANTKAARAACRAGKAPADAPSATDPSPRARLREKAASASQKLGQPKAEGQPAPTITGTLSGFCGVGNHELCPGGGRQWSCSCDCHSSSHAE